ncbi:hypothetical protein [Gordonia soli]|uniref:Uncharacterized protein n=1 Tax=Gordonia soli NBRC 108243 TaxID=1223545 RepID=M0QK40_9ACTN|nr:hypothetical protein [Gordonia soli]GAC67802.1 hypothetical protein GS4_11_00710 [Gordonia soli NBRC 108243]
MVQGGRRSLVRQTALVAASAGVATVGIALGAASADAAPGGAALRVDQVPNAGVAVVGNRVAGGFVAPISARAAGAGVTRITLSPQPAQTSPGTLNGSRVGLTWRNERTGKSGNATFPTNSGIDVTTGPGRITFTTSIIGRGDRSFTVIPGNGSIFR